jgi:hypothetical protein
LVSGPAKGLKRFAIIAGVAVTAGLIGLDIATQRQAARRPTFRQLRP